MIFKQRWGALAFAVLVIFAVGELVGGEEEPGLVADIASNVEPEQAQAGREAALGLARGATERASQPTVSPRPVRPTGRIAGDENTFLTESEGAAFNPDIASGVGDAGVGAADRPADMPEDLPDMPLAPEPLRPDLDPSPPPDDNAALIADIERLMGDN